MQITDVRINGAYNPDSKVKAIASIVLDNEFAIHDIKVIESNDRVFLSFPSRRMPNGEYRDIAHPITSDCREKIQKVVLDAYNNMEIKK